MVKVHILKVNYVIIVKDFTAQRKGLFMKTNLDNRFYKLKRQPFVTYGLLAVTILMYLLMTFNGGSENPWTLMIFGAKVNEYIVHGDWWRLITPVFLHIGFTHLLFNGLVIYFLGIELEMIIGHFRFLLLYLLSGLLGNAASFAFNSSISAGASTAIFGMFATTIVLGKLYPYHSKIQRLSRDYIALIIINVISGFFNQSIDNAGHLGGMLCGYLIMYVLSSKNAINNPTKKRMKYGLIYLLSLIILIVIGYIRTTSFVF